ncbi:MAG: hypothetical protein LBS19_10165 [Clostridiales bacterium]|jgi:hypothetical protein|nr:hypothetical protein [Clostridiales bacterium]
MIFTMFRVPARAADSKIFTDAIKTRFIGAISGIFPGNPYYYEYFALHDMDNDGIPELLLGREPNDFNSEQVYYAVWKYDVLDDEFVFIGRIDPCVYLMKDRFSNAILGLYTDASRQTVAYFNYYFTDSTVGRNTVLSASIGDQIIYDTMVIMDGYFYNDQAITEDRFLEIYKVTQGTYDELIVHDIRGFADETVHVAVQSWKPYDISKNPRIPTNLGGFTRAWQQPMYDMIETKRGPSDTFVSEDDQWITPLITLNPQRDYGRYALHDFDGDFVPELLLGLRDGQHFSYDVYKWWRGELRYNASFDCYAQYLAIESGTGNIFTYDAVANEFYDMSAKKVYLEDNALATATLLARNGDLYYQSAGGGSLSSSRFNRAQFVGKLSDYVIQYNEIRTFDIGFVPPDIVLIHYIMTNGFTRMGS